MNMERERLKFSVDRFDHYYDSINNKCNVFLGLSTFIVGGLIAAYPSLLEKVECGFVTHALMGTLLSLGLAIMIIVSTASTPYLSKSGNSLLFFADIAGQTEAQFQQLSAGETEAAAVEDMRRQVYKLAVGLNGKFKKLRVAGQLMILQFVLFIPLVIIIVTNLK